MNDIPIATPTVIPIMSPILNPESDSSLLELLQYYYSGIIAVLFGIIIGHYLGLS